MTEQERFEKVATALINSGTEDFQVWSKTFLCILYAYEQWKDGAEWDYVQEVLSGLFDK